MSDAIDEFESDTHRRVAANLAQPRSAAGLARFLAAIDPHVTSKAYTPAGVQDYLDDLVKEGLVVRIGGANADVKTAEDAKDAAEAVVAEIKGHDEVPTLPKEKAANWIASSQKRTRRGEIGDVQYVATQAFFDRVAGPIPNEPPPLEGEALAAAEAQNAAMED